MEPRTVKKAVNRVKASLDQRRGPVEKDQSGTPIADAIGAYWERDMLTFAIPAHNGGRGPLPEVAKGAGLDAIRSDVSMSHGVDTRDRAWKVLSTAQELFAEASGAEQVLFSTNGSSMNVHVALLAVAGENGQIIVARTGHKSLFAGLVISGAKPVYVDPVYDEDLELAHVPTAEAIVAALREHPDARGVLITTP